MSSSPKRCRARLNERRRRETEEKRRREAERERQRRLAAEQRRRQERLERDRTKAQTEASRIVSQLDAAAGSDAVNYMREPLADLREQVAGRQAAIEQATDDRTMTQHQEALERLADRLRKTIAAAKTELLAERLANEEKNLAILDGRFAAFNSHWSLKFDAPGRKRIQTLLDQARQALEQKSPEVADQATREAADAFAKHAAQVEETQRQVSERAAVAVQRAERAGDIVSGLQTDPVVSKWKGKRLAELQMRVDQLPDLIKGDHFEAAEAAAAEVTTSAAELVEEAGQIQLQDDHRQQIVAGICEVLKGMHFDIESSGLEHLEHPRSATIIRTYAPEGGTLDVSVPQDGEIWYSVDKARMRAHAMPDGQEGHSCDEAEEQILKLHETLRDAFGIETSELQWEGKDPSRINKRAERLPDSTDVQTPRQRSQEH